MRPTAKLSVNGITERAYQRPHHQAAAGHRRLLSPSNGFMYEYGDISVSPANPRKGHGAFLVFRRPP